MRFLFLLLLPFSFFSQTKVNVEILQKFNYCGGAKPPAEILAQYEKPRPYANKKLIIVSANGKTATTTTDSNGYLKVKLKPGSYKLYEEWRYKKSTPDGSDIKNFDKACLQTAWAKVDITINAQKKTQEIKVTIDDAYCQHTIPCLTNPHLPE